MFCSGCGTQLDALLNYCNRCGNRVPKSESVSVGENLAQSVSYVGGFGLLGFIFVAAVLLRKGVPMEAFVPIAAFYLTALVAVCWLILKYSTKMLTGRGTVTENRATDTPAELTGRITAQLDEPRQPVASVVDHTTRTLDKTPITR